MDDFLSILVLFVIYLFAAVSGNRKKKKAKQNAVPGNRRVFPDGAHGSADTPTPDAQARTQQHQQTCRTESLHLHDVTQSDMLEAAEGEDPCHAGGYDGYDAIRPEADGEQQMRRALAEDVLRGVIMSEILTRPGARAAARRNGRRV